MVESLESFTQRATAWLESVAPRRAQVTWGQGSDSVSVFENWTAEQERAHTDEIRAHEQRKFDAGFGAIDWSPEFGGPGLGIEHRLAFRALEEEFDVPRRTELFPVTQQLIAPTIAQWGTDEQKATYLRALLRTDMLACQLFSETEAGSDLAAVRTRGEQQADGTWRIDGHKVWTSGARVADIGVAVVRTDPTVAKHAGLTVFIVPLDTPGVTVRPIRQMSGGAAFNEVYLDGVVLDDSLRLGPVGQGWKVALTVLAAERLDSGLLGLDNADRAVDLAMNLGRPLPQLCAAPDQHARGRLRGGRQRPGPRIIGRQAVGHRHHGAHV
jgi:alkylation response protein AidB-like acyl-CoA dehydrogenase